MCGATAHSPREIEVALRALPGVGCVRANALTGSVLVHYSVTLTHESAILALLDRLERALPRTGAGAVRHEPRRLRTNPVPSIVRGPDRAVVSAFAVDLLVIGPAKRHLADLLIKGLRAVLSLLLADSPLGLIFAGLDALSLIADIAMSTEIVSRHPV